LNYHHAPSPEHISGPNTVQIAAGSGGHRQLMARALGSPGMQVVLRKAAHFPAGNTPATHAATGVASTTEPAPCTSAITRTFISSKSFCTRNAQKTQSKVRIAFSVRSSACHILENFSLKPGSRRFHESHARATDRSALSLRKFAPKSRIRPSLAQVAGRTQTTAQQIVQGSRRL